MPGFKSQLCLLNFLHLSLSFLKQECVLTHQVAGLISEVVHVVWVHRNTQ